ncbi:hypothetical protein TRIP_B220090 [uncultured Desulfatiglans sp.]|uniref:Uncharacterized protein n=1 Tax=Uncultured Desulfatiglans sp. TaxID=1748965 RepID=A0A653A599_UNCDX|nr:hypothetical protein TRIP_B220090 [uncultured Desulfatiglans sp.]
MLKLSQTAPDRQRRRIFELVEEALQARGFSEGETAQILERLVRCGEDASWPPPADFSRREWSTMPFGKYAGLGMDELPSNYLLWLTDQDWFEAKYYGLFLEACDVLEGRQEGRP